MFPQERMRVYGEKREGSPVSAPKMRRLDFHLLGRDGMRTQRAVNTGTGRACDSPQRIWSQNGFERPFEMEIKLFWKDQMPSKNLFGKYRVCGNSRFSGVVCKARGGCASARVCMCVHKCLRGDPAGTVTEVAEGEDGPHGWLPHEGEVTFLLESQGRLSRRHERGLTESELSGRKITVIMPCGTE